MTTLEDESLSGACRFRVEFNDNHIEPHEENQERKQNSEVPPYVSVGVPIVAGYKGIAADRQASGN